MRTFNHDKKRRQAAISLHWSDPRFSSLIWSVHHGRDDRTNAFPISSIARIFIWSRDEPSDGWVFARSIRLWWRHATTPRMLVVLFTECQSLLEAMLTEREGCVHHEDREERKRLYDLGLVLVMFEEALAPDGCSSVTVLFERWSCRRSLRIRSNLISKQNELKGEYRRVLTALERLQSISPVFDRCLWVLGRCSETVALNERQRLSSTSDVQARALPDSVGINFDWSSFKLTCW